MYQACQQDISRTGILFCVNAFRGFAEMFGLHQREAQHLGGSGRKGGHTIGTSIGVSGLENVSPFFLPSCMGTCRKDTRHKKGVF